MCVFVPPPPPSFFFSNDGDGGSGAVVVGLAPAKNIDQDPKDRKGGSSCSLGSATDPRGVVLSSSLVSLRHDVLLARPLSRKGRYVRRPERAGKTHTHTQQRGAESITQKKKESSTKETRLVAGRSGGQSRFGPVDTHRRSEFL